MLAFDLKSTYVCLAPDGAAASIEVTPDFWSTIDQRADLNEGRLVAVFESSADWPHWERHPEGEELLVLLSGKMTLLFEPGGKDQADGDPADQAQLEKEHSMELTPGRACIVPRGVWHRARVPVPSRLLAITHGRGTEHRAR